MEFDIWKSKVEHLRRGFHVLSFPWPTSGWLCGPPLLISSIAFCQSKIALCFAADTWYIQLFYYSTGWASDIQ